MDVQRESVFRLWQMACLMVLPPLLAYPVGDDDKDIEREILVVAECYIFFTGRSKQSSYLGLSFKHGKGEADTRREGKKI